MSAMVYELRSGPENAESAGQYPEQIEVVYWVPRTLRRMRLAKVGLAIVLVEICAAAGLLGGIGMGALGGAIPWWLMATTFLVAVTIVPLILRLASADLRQKLILTQEAILLQGLGRNYQVPYSEVKLVDISEPQRIGKKVGRITFALFKGQKACIDLSAPDAQECFHAVRSLCERAAAVDTQGTVLLPSDPQAAASRAAEHATALRRRSVIVRITAVICILVSAAVLIGLTVSPTVRARGKAWGIVIVFPFMAIGFWRAGIAMRREAERLVAEQSSTREEPG